MEKENYQIHRQASQDPFCWTKGHLMDFHGPGWDLQGNKQPQDPIMYGRICGSICLMQRKRKQRKNGISRNQSSIMPDNWKESSSLNLMMRNSETTSKTFGESWKFWCQQQCLAKYRYRAVEKPTAILGNARRNTLVLLMPTKARDRGLKEPAFKWRIQCLAFCNRSALRSRIVVSFKSDAIEKHYFLFATFMLRQWLSVLFLVVAPWTYRRMVSVFALSCFL